MRVLPKLSLNDLTRYGGLASAKHPAPMNDTPPLNLPARLSIAALFILGLVGGTLIVAYSGYETSPRRGSTPVFVPMPQAYIIAASLYAMSCLAMLALLRSRTKSSVWAALAVAAYGLLAWLFAQSLGDPERQTAFKIANETPCFLSDERTFFRPNFQ